MAGRYGFDQFGGFLCISSLILIVIGAWVSPVLYWLGLAAIVYSYFRCPQCGQQLRVPRGRGKISITCPKCGHQFIKKS